VTDGCTGYVRSTEAGLIEALAQVDRLDRHDCRQAAVQRFSAERMVADHLDLDQQVIEGHGQPPVRAA
jgi:hypothetical protein